MVIKMKAEDARENAYNFYAGKIEEVMRLIKDASMKGEMQIQVDNLPWAIRDYLLEEGFGINENGTYTSNISTIYWWR